MAGSYIAKNSSSRGEQNGSSLCGWANGQQFCQKLRHSRAYASKAEQSRIQRWLSTGLSSQPLDAICVKRKDKLIVKSHSIINRGATRTAPNPNVLIELGWALKALGKDRIIMLLNEAYGDMELLPFDLHTYRISPYRMAGDEDRAVARKNLESTLKAAPSSILSTLDASQPKEEVISPVGQAQRSVESNRRDQKARVRDYIADVARRIPFIISKDTNSELDEQLTQALEESTGLIIECSQLAKTIAEMNAGDAAMAMYKGFAKVLDLYTGKCPPK